MPKCRIGLATGGDLQEVEFGEAATIGDVLSQTQLKPRLGDQLLLNGKAVAVNHPLQNGDTLLVSAPVEGG